METDAAPVEPAPAAPAAVEPSATVGGALLPARYGFAAEQVEAIRQTVAKDCNDAELVVFLEVCARYQLDPFAKQAYAAKMGGGGVSIIVSRDGLLAHAHRQQDFVRMDGDVVCKGDTFNVRFADGERAVEHSYGNPSERGEVVGAWASVERRGHGSTFFYAPMAEYRKGSPIWKSNPSSMILKCFAPDTEILTTAGYEPITMISGEVLQVTDDGLEAVDSKPFVQHFEGELVEADGRDLNFAVTPDHRMVTDQGIVTAGEMYDNARRRAVYRIPLSPENNKIDAVISDEQIALAAAYAADGTDAPQSPNRFHISVSRKPKVSALEALGLGVAPHGRPLGKSSAAATRAKQRRVVLTRQEKLLFTYSRVLIDQLVGTGKVIRVDALLQLSQRQARIFVDTWQAFDGDDNHRIYTSRPDHAAALEIAAAQAGYSVSPRRSRTNDLSNRPNYVLNIGQRDSVPVVKGDSAPTGLLRRAYAGAVWCVTVPSGKIMVRRNGHAMVCGQCAESYALRKGYSISGVVGAEEVGQTRETLTASPEDAVARPQADIDYGDNPVLATELREALRVAHKNIPGKWLPAKVRALLDGASNEDRQKLLEEINADLAEDAGIEDAEVVDESEA